MTKSTRFLWLPRLRVRDALQFATPAICKFPYSMISSIDSCCDPAALPSIARLLDANEDIHVVSSEPFVIRSDGLDVLLNDRNFFTGFDEIWCFEGTDWIAPSDGVSLVAPMDLNASDIAPINRWMSKSSCQLGLGDGDGLNVAAKTPGVLAEVISALGVADPGIHES